MSMLLSVVMTVAGLALLATAMPRHWRQLRPSSEPAAGIAILMRVFGAAMLAGSLWLCLLASHPTIGSIVWVMELGLGAAAVAMIYASAGRSADRHRNG